MSKKLFAFLSLLTAFAFSEVRASDAAVVTGDEEESVVAAVVGVKSCSQEAEWTEWATRLSETTGDTWREDFAALIAVLGEEEAHAALVTRLRGALDAGDGAEWREAVEAVTALLRATESTSAVEEVASGVAALVVATAGEGDEEAGLAPVGEAVVEQAAEHSATESGDEEGEGSD